ncbi:MAG: hypothetical protein MUP85_19550 [Candidatus Lokiarchaeota archaeon]|nr:hypothetical protein [Candidatus Lokiarchaeota archaeon]
MSSNLFAYKFKNDQWHNADDINESDIVVIVDSSRNIIWYFEGRNSSARKRNNARGLLGDLKKKHATYKFKKITSNTPRDIIRELQILKEQFFASTIKQLNVDISKISQLYFYLNAFGNLLIIVSLTIIILLIGGTGTRIYENYMHFSIRLVDFEMIFMVLSLLSLISFLLFLFAGLTVLILKQKIIATYNIFGSVLIFIAFYMIITWTNILYFEVDYQIILIRIDVFTIFAFSLAILYIISLFIGFVMSILGFKKVEQAIEEEE